MDPKILFLLLNATLLVGLVSCQKTGKKNAWRPGFKMSAHSAIQCARKKHSGTDNERTAVKDAISSAAVEAGMNEGEGTARNTMATEYGEYQATVRCTRELGLIDCMDCTERLRKELDDPANQCRNAESATHRGNGEGCAMEYEKMTVYAFG